MRIIQSLLVILMLSIPFLSSAVFAEGSANQTAIIAVDGLSCPFCTYGLEKNLKKVDGIKTVRIDMKTGKATVVLKPDAHVDDAALKEAVEKAGFTARKITRQ